MFPGMSSSWVTIPVEVERPEKPIQFGRDRAHLAALLSEGQIEAVIIPGDTGYQSIFGGGELVSDMESFSGCWST